MKRFAPTCLLTGLLAAVALPLVAQEAESSRAEMRAELDTLADRVVLPRAFNLIHQLVGPSVVSIHTSEQVMLTRFGRPVDTREMEVGEGSGFVFHSDEESSWVLTNAHVAMRTDRRQQFVLDAEGQPVPYDAIQIPTIGGAMHEAVPVGADIQTDLAVLRCDIPDLPMIEWGDSDAAQVGDYVAALGHPLEIGYSATFGNISATEKSTGVYERQGGYESFIQTDAAINPGNSGGPLVDLRGQVIGVNANIVTRGGGNIGIGFAIPASLARRVAEDLRDDGRVSRPMVGITMAALSPAEAKQLGVPNPQAVRVTLVVPGSPAESAGLQDGDLVLAVDEIEVVGTQQLRSRIAAAIERYSAFYELDPDLVLAVMLVESNARPWAHSPKGAVGLMQVMPHMMQPLGLAGNLATIESNIEAGCFILSHNIRRLGIEDGISAYFWGSDIRGVAYLEKVLEARARVKQLVTS